MTRTIGDEIREAVATSSATKAKAAVRWLRREHGIPHGTACAMAQQLTGISRADWDALTGIAWHA